MYDYKLHNRINSLLKQNEISPAGADIDFYTRMIANAAAISDLYEKLYRQHPDASETFEKLLTTLLLAYKNRPVQFREKDAEKEKQSHWFLSNELTGMSLYVDRFSGKINQLEKRLPYLKELGVNLLHLMPVFESPQGESDGGYAVSDFRKVDQRFGTLQDLKDLQKKMSAEKMYLMIDIVLNHTSQKHSWAEKARLGEKKYQDYFYFFADRQIPDSYDRSMPEIFPESSPGNFTYVEECNKWVMTVFHHYQWDLNYTNPAVFVEMLDNILFYANLGIDILRIDAPAFIWKEIGTTCQNLPMAHTLLRLIKQCVQVAAPGMALLGEAIVAPNEIMKYFGTGNYRARECDLAYNATHMALQWDALATGDTRVMLAAQHEILQKPFGTSWITYTRCHDDIGLGYDDYMIEKAGFNPYAHRMFLKNYYSGNTEGSPARGALFSFNPKTQDARISGTLASLCGLETALLEKNEEQISLSIKKILLMQAHSFFISGIPMLYYGDETGYTNDYSYLQDPAKSYDNRWMHRPVIDWDKNARVSVEGSTEQRIYQETKHLLAVRKKLSVLADHKNLEWLTPHNIHIAGYLRRDAHRKLYCLFNFSNKASYLTWYLFREHGGFPEKLYDHVQEKSYTVGYDHEYFIMEPYTFNILEAQ